MKSWKCSQCGKAVEKGLVQSVGGGPSECDHCGNEEFEEPVTIGSVHTKLDRILS